MPTKDGAPDTATSHRRRGDAAEHDRALAADDHEAELRRQRHAQRGEKQARRADSVFWSENALPKAPRQTSSKIRRAISRGRSEAARMLPQ